MKKVTSRGYQGLAGYSLLMVFHRGFTHVIVFLELSSKTYSLLGVDLSQTNTLEAALKMCDLDLDRPTLLLSECVLTYMTRRW